MVAEEFREIELDMEKEEKQKEDLKRNEQVMMVMDLKRGVHLVFSNVFMVLLSFVLIGKVFHMSELSFSKAK